jgi:hypothetical protein
MRRYSCYELGTIHDCFYIKPQYQNHLRYAYKADLLFAVVLNELNIMNWLHSICNYYNIQINESSIQHTKRLITIITKLRRGKMTYQFALSEYSHAMIVCNDIITLAIKDIEAKVFSKVKNSLNKVKEYIEQREENNYSNIVHLMTLGGDPLFPDNK